MAPPNLLRQETTDGSGRFYHTVYGLVCGQYRAICADHPLRHGGVAPQLTDEEVITLEICGEYFTVNTGQDLSDCFKRCGRIVNLFRLLHLVIPRAFNLILPSVSGVS